MSIGETSIEPSSKSMGKRSGKRPGRKASRIDESAKLERSRQSARECRARKKLRYQYLEELVLHREKAVFALRDELEMYKQWCTQLDTEQRVPDSLLKMIVSERLSHERKQMEQANRSILQQQRQEEESYFSSSTSTDSSPSAQHEHSQHHHRIGAESSVVSLSSLHQTPSCSQQQIHHVGLGPVFRPQSTHKQTSSPPQHQRQQIGTEQSYKLQGGLHQTPSSSNKLSHLQLVVEPSFQPRSAQHQPSSSSQQQRHQSGAEHPFPSQSTHHQTSSTKTDHLRKLSPHRGQLIQTIEDKATLQRQFAFDESFLEDAQSTTQSEVITPKMTTAIQSHPRSFESKTSILPQQHRVQQLLHQHHIQHPRAESSSSATQHYNIPQHIAQRSRQPQMTTIKNESPSKYEHPVDIFHSLSSAGLGSIPLHIARSNPSMSTEPRRARSYSNPASMMQFPRASTHGSSTRSLPGSSLSVQKSHPMPGPPGPTSSQGLGLFSGSMIGLNFAPLTLNIPASAAVEESSSSDENINEQQLFNFSFMPQKRASADPAVVENPHRTRTSRSTTFPSGSTASNTDPQITLSNLTTVNCLSTTRTCNTPSPSSRGLSPSGLRSPTPVSKYTGISGSTSSSSSTSPAPLSSLSSLLELSASSPGIPTSTFSTHLDPSDLHVSEHGSSSSIQDSLHCSALSLSASIDEPIPELYSFLADLEEGGMSSFTSRHGASSSHSTPLALTPKQNDQPLTPEPAYLNVPKIIDEYLDSDKDD